MFKNSKVSQQIDDNVSELQNDYQFISALQISQKNLSFVVHLNKKYTGKGICGI